MKIAFQQRVRPTRPFLRDYQRTKHKEVDVFSADTLYQRWVVVIQSWKELQFGDTSVHFFREVWQHRRHTIQTWRQQQRWRIWQLAKSAKRLIQKCITQCTALVLILVVLGRNHDTYVLSNVAVTSQDSSVTTVTRPQAGKIREVQIPA